MSKTLAPALRLGWVVAPAACARSWWCASSGRTSRSPALGQLALAELITSGGFERHLRKVRGPAARTAATRCWTRCASTCPTRASTASPPACTSLVGLPDGVDDGAVAERALAAGVAVQPLSYHRLRPGPPGLVIGYAATTPDRLWEGVGVLADAVRGTARRP